MKILVQNIQYLEVDIPDEDSHLLHDDPQLVVDSADLTNAELVSDDYYEYVEILKEL